MQLPLVKSLAPLIQQDCAGLESGNAPILEKVTPVTADLLRWWFQQDCCDARPVNFHDGHGIALGSIVRGATPAEYLDRLDLQTADNQPPNSSRSAPGSSRTALGSSRSMPGSSRMAVSPSRTPPGSSRASLGLMRTPPGLSRTWLGFERLPPG